MTSSITSKKASALVEEYFSDNVTNNPSVEIKTDGNYLIIHGHPNQTGIAQLLFDPKQKIHIQFWLNRGAACCSYIKTYLENHQADMDKNVVGVFRQIVHTETTVFDILQVALKA